MYIYSQAHVTTISVPIDHSPLFQSPVLKVLNVRMHEVLGLGAGSLLGAKADAKADAHSSRHFINVKKD